MELSRGISIMEKKSQEKDFGRRVKSSARDRQLMRVEIRHIPTPDAESRLYHAIDILLGSAAGEPEGSTNVTKRKTDLKIAHLKG